MARRKQLTDAQVLALKPGAKRALVPDPELAGHGVRVSPTGVKSFVVVARTPGGKQVWRTLGTAPKMPVADARQLATKAIAEIKAGTGAPVAADTFATVSANWYKRVVVAERHRTGDETRRVLDKYILPAWGERPFTGIRRKDLAVLLDHIQDAHGARQADICLTVIRAISRWYALRDEDYINPVVPGLRRSKARARDRILNDDELRALWAASDGTTIGGIFRFALLTAQRIGVILPARWSDIGDDGVWTIPTEDRAKFHGGPLKLSEAALEVVRRQPRIAGNPFIFAVRGALPYGNIGDAKLALARRAGVSDWTLHDARRTARTLMERAGVPHANAEAVLGHREGNAVSKIYTRHDYLAEKAAALATLARLVETIINPPGDNVVPLHRDSAAG